MRAFPGVLLALMLIASGKCLGQDGTPQERPAPTPAPVPYGPPPPTTPNPSSTAPPALTPAAEPEPEPEAPETPKVLQITTVVEPTARMTTRIAFVVDTSGSMGNFARIGVALGFARSLLGREGDEMEVAIYAFTGESTRWEGFPHDGNGPPPPPGWTYFPSVPAFNAASDWLAARGAKGHTNPVQSVKEALAERVGKLTVVIITDGEFGLAPFKEAVRDGQAARVAAGHGEAVFMCVGVGPNARGQAHLRDVGGQGGGFFLVEEVEVPAEEAPPEDR